MDEYIGLDVSLKETAISVRRDGKRVWRGKCASDPAVLAEEIRKRAPIYGFTVTVHLNTKAGAPARYF